MPPPARTFIDKPATREKVPLLIGLAGPSGGGKTYSALRLAAGMQRVTGGDIYVIDTEARRALHYADRFRFRHLEFAAPFGPLDYLAAIEHCHKKGAGIIVIDSQSHEHEGPGGVLEMHERELDRMAGQDYAKRMKMTMLAWAKPKAERRRLLNTILQIPCNFIFCFRAKAKIKMKKGEEPQQLGFMPIAGEEFVYEMTAHALLLPSAGGVPTWASAEIGEKQMIKLPQQFRGLFQGQNGPLDEAAGEYMARWAAGEAASPAYMALVDRMTLVQTVAELDALAPDVKKATDEKAVKEHEVRHLRGLYANRKREIETAVATPAEPQPSEESSPAKVVEPAGDKLFGEPGGGQLPD